MFREFVRLVCKISVFSDKSSAIALLTSERRSRGSCVSSEATRLVLTRMPGSLTEVPQDGLTFAAMDLGERINEEMAGHVVPQVLYDRVEKTHSLMVQPITLLGAMWYQFAKSIANGEDLRSCKLCQEWFTYDPKDGRKSRKLFCSVSGKLNDSRKRQPNVLRLASRKLKPTGSHVIRTCADLLSAVLNYAVRMNA